MSAPFDNTIKERLRDAEDFGVKRFNIPQDIWNKMTPEAQWAASQKFLDRVIQRGDNVRLSVNAFSEEAKDGISLQKEINYLQQRGYRISDDGWTLIKQ
jgi:hypothetical protein